MTTPKTVPLILTAAQWVDLLSPDGSYLQKCCGNLSAGRQALAEMLPNAAKTVGAATAGPPIERARYDAESDGVIEAATSLAELARGSVSLSEDDARSLVQCVGTHDVHRRVFFPDESDMSPSWATEEGSPWPTIAAACRELLGDLRPVVS